MLLSVRLMKSYLEVIRGYLGVVGLLVADEGHQVRSLEIAGAALEVVGSAAFRRHHLLSANSNFLIFKFFPRAQKTRLMSRGYRSQLNTLARKGGEGEGTLS